MKNWPDNIPKSNLTGYITVNAALSTPEGEASILFLNPQCVVLGLNGEVNTLFITPDFDLNKLPSSIGTNIFNVKTLILQSNFTTNQREYDGNYMLPEWLLNFNKLSELHIKSADLSNLDYLMESSIEHLTLCDIYYTDEQNLLIDILRFKDLKEVICDDSLSSNIKNIIQTKNIKLLPYKED